MNVNMVTCGGQATIPMVAAVSRVQPVDYGEIVATVSSKSAGPGTRKEHRQFTRTTAGRSRRSAVPKGQGHHHHQPGRAAADHARHRALPDRDRADQAAITESIHAMIRKCRSTCRATAWSTARCSTATASPCLPGSRRPRRLPAQVRRQPRHHDRAGARTAEMFAEILAG